MNKISSIYISKIKTLFPILGKSEKKYINTLKLTVEDFMENSTDISMEDLYIEFGEPKDVVNEYYNTIDTEKIIKRIKLSKYIKLFICLLIICSFVTTICYCCHLYKTHQALMKENFIYSEETIIE